MKAVEAAGGVGVSSDADGACSELRCPIDGAKTSRWLPWDFVKHVGIGRLPGTTLLNIQNIQNMNYGRFIYNKVFFRFVQNVRKFKIYV